MSIQLDDNTSAAWLASTVNRKMPAAALQGVDIGATARRALNYRTLQSLRVEGHLMYGVAALVAQKTHLLASQTGRTRRELERELNGEENLMDQAIDIPTQSQSIDMISSDFNMDRVMEEFRPSQLSQASDPVADISIDDELRGEVDDELRREDPAETYAPEILSDGDEQILRGILGEDEPMAPIDAPVVDDMVFEEALTPPSMPDLEELEPEVALAPTKRPSRPRKKRLCPVDERTTISRPTRAPASTLLDSQTTGTTTGTTTRTTSCTTADDDDFFDPERISDSIKRRRLVDIPSDVPELDHSEADLSIAGISMDGLLDDGMDEEMGDYDEPAATQDVVGSILEQENLEDLMAEEIQTARRTIKDYGSGKFSEIPSHTQRSRAALFSEALALATMGDISLEQQGPYQEIMLLAI